MTPKQAQPGPVTQELKKEMEKARQENAGNDQRPGQLRNEEAEGGSRVANFNPLQLMARLS